MNLIFQKEEYARFGLRNLFTALLILFAFVQVSFSQNNVGLKFFGLSIHPKGEQLNAFLMPRKLDQNGYFVVNLGGMLSYEYFLYKDILSVKVVQALYSDCAARLGGISHIGLRGRIFKYKRHSLYGGIGPTVAFRRNWLEMKGYTNLNRFVGDSNAYWQYLFLWYGGEFEYSYCINSTFDFSTTFVPGYPDLMSLSFGLKYKFQ